MAWLPSASCSDEVVGGRAVVPVDGDHPPGAHRHHRRPQGGGEVDPEVDPLPLAVGRVAAPVAPRGHPVPLGQVPAPRPRWAGEGEAVGAGGAAGSRRGRAGGRCAGGRVQSPGEDQGGQAPRLVRDEDDGSAVRAEVPVVVGDAEGGLRGVCQAPGFAVGGGDLPHLVGVCAGGAHGNQEEAVVRRPAVAPQEVDPAPLAAVCAGDPEAVLGRVGVPHGDVRQPGAVRRGEQPHQAPGAGEVDQAPATNVQHPQSGPVLAAAAPGEEEAGVGGAVGPREEGHRGGVEGQGEAPGALAVCAGDGEGGGLEVVGPAPPGHPGWGRRCCRPPPSRPGRRGPRWRWGGPTRGRRGGAGRGCPAGPGGASPAASPGRRSCPTGRARGCAVPSPGRRPTSRPCPAGAGRRAGCGPPRRPTRAAPDAPRRDRPARGGGPGRGRRRGRDGHRGGHGGRGGHLHRGWPWGGAGSGATPWGRDWGWRTPPGPRRRRQARRAVRRDDSSCSR